MESSDEEMDYMSETFLNISESGDVRPGLIKSQAVLKQLEKERRQKEANERSRIKPRRVLEEEKRTEAMNQPLGDGNKGFLMMQKMGFKSGMALGKEGSSGLKQPIPVVLKSDRQGLGRDAELKRKHEKKEQDMINRIKRMKRDEKQITEDYLQRMRSKSENQRSIKALKKAQTACEYLDSQKGVEEPAEWFYWPDEASSTGYRENYGLDDEEGERETEGTADAEEEAEDEEEEEEQIQPIEKLERVVSYLRSEHLYCIWCGTGYEDVGDMDANCPGESADDHD